MSDAPERDVVWAGHVFDGIDLFEGYIVHDGATVIEVDEGRPPREPDVSGLVVPAPVNAHTHLGDTAMRGAVDVPGDLAAAVAPPDGVKHTFLQRAGRAELVAGMRRGLGEAAAAGVGLVADFREGGRSGIEMLDEAARGSAVGVAVFARSAPAEPEAGELDDLLERAAGLGLSGLADVTHATADAYADACRRAGKPLGLHFSEAQREDVDAALALEPAFVVHACAATPRDLERLRDEGVGVVTCPRSNALFGQRAPIEAVVELGLDWALGTDNGWFNSPDIWREAAWILEKWPETPPAALLKGLCHAQHEVLKNGDHVARFEAGRPVRAAVLENGTQSGPRAALRRGRVAAVALP